MTHSTSAADFSKILLFKFKFINGKIIGKIPLNVSEFTPKFTDSAGGIGNLLSFLKLQVMGFVVK